MVIDCTGKYRGTYVLSVLALSSRFDGPGKVDGAIK